jgi:hypothetical protein
MTPFIQILTGRPGLSSSLCPYYVHISLVVTNESKGVFFPNSIQPSVLCVKKTRMRLRRGVRPKVSSGHSTSGQMHVHKMNQNSATLRTQYCTVYKKKGKVKGAEKPVAIDF